LAQRSIDVLKNHFNIAIADEAHYLKGLETKRAETVVPLLKICKRVILLTGTPAFAKPKELFSLLSIIRPDIYFSFTPFGERYCNPQKSPWSNSVLYDGSNNEAELHYILKSAIMIRRLKSQVLIDLPDKLRQKIVIDTDTKYTKQINAILSSLGSTSEFEFTEKGDQSESFIKCYALTASAKIESIKQYIE
jgi:SWI/SNF-related matrix-associated actin-dependent regulator 1 of chromatin subfamily A